MCGIAAIAGNIDTKHYKTGAMLEKLERRGPDGKGDLTFPRCWLGHRRLSIIDLKRGNQPMIDGVLSISFNGEIYNHHELREEMRKEGYHFQTQSDTETILKAYRKWGEECPKHLDGMFSFVIWDNERHELFIARDRLGKKPLYYFFDDDTILLASEIKSLIASGALALQIDYGAIDDYLRLMYIPPHRSVYKNVHTIPPAHCGIFKDGKLSLKRYWTLAHKPISISYEDAKTETSRLLHNAVKKRLTASDVEIGAFLSGGTDSTLVACIAAEKLNHSLKTFSIGYSGPMDEIPFAKQACEKIGGEHFTTDIDRCLTPELDEVIAYLDEPHADTSDFPQHLVSRLAAQEVKVVLSGDGADELFLGYKWHVQRENSSPDLFYERLHSICAFPLKQRSQLWKSSDMVNTDIPAQYVCEDTLSPIDRITIFDLTSHLPGQILTKVDRASMMHGLEVRCPFLDTALVEFVFNLPYEYKVNGKIQKYIIKDILAGYMPSDFVYRPKQGFGSPIGIWLNHPIMKEYTYSKLGPNAKIRSIFSEKGIDRCLYDFYINNNKPERASQRLWVLLCLEGWTTRLDINL